MKELSIEEKAKAYDMALDKIERLLGIGDNCSRKELEHIFPELKESEDERIRKVLIEAAIQVLQDQYCSNRGVSKEKVIAWLEKQGETFTKKDIDDAYLKGVCDTKHELEKQDEQKPVEPQQDMLSQEKYAKAVDECIYGEHKPAEWSEEDEYCRHQLIVFCENCMQQDSGAIRCANWLKSLKERVQPQPKQEWSERDKEIIEALISLCDEAQDNIPQLSALKNWLKSLRPQSTWKPTDEQIKALDIAIRCGIQLGTWEEEALKSLKEQLKKLREE